MTDPQPGIYVHLPFCKVHCAYCDFPLTTRLSLADSYYRCLLQEIASNPAPPADTLYFGGGTPSQTPPEILLQIRECFSLLDGSEITLEANPDDVTTDLLRGWRGAGINRVSLGIQSLEKEPLRASLRQHTADEARGALSLARGEGYDNLNVDLILGLPRQTVRGFLDGLSLLVDFRPQHFSLYFLEVHESTALRRQIHLAKETVMEEEDQVACYEQAVSLLESAGYVHYEVSNFALPGFASRHNLKYWTAAPYYGYGAGACSYHDSMRIQNIASVAEYIGAAREGRPVVASSAREDEETRMRNALIFGLRRREGVDIAGFEARFGASPVSLFPDAEELLRAGFLQADSGRIRLTFRGMLLSNEILSRLV